MPEKIAILGLGLMGGSLGLALKKLDCTEAVMGFSRSAESRTLALARGAVDAVYDRPEDAVRGADLVVACAPVLSLPELVERCLPALERDAVVTDVGSAKAWVVARLEAQVAAVCRGFVGSHPIAGGERHGITAARPDLYEGAVVVVTPTARTDAQALERVRVFWRRLGARVRETSPEEHDRILARTSHLPHLAAAALATCVGREAPEDTADFCGAGFADMTRIAAGDPRIWHDIAKTNCNAIESELREYRNCLDNLLDMLEKQNFERLLEFLEKSRRVKQKLPSPNSGSGC